MANNYEVITDGVIKIFEKDANVTSAAPLLTVTGANTDDLRYLFENVDEGEYTYSASATGKGTVVGSFKLPWDGRLEEEFTKFIPDIFLTPAVPQVTINLVDKDDNPDGIRSYINSGVRVLVMGIDGAFTTNGDWVVPNTPTEPNALIEIKPDNPASLQNLKVIKPISETYNYHSIKVMPPFKLLINIMDVTNTLSMNSISRVAIKGIDGVWVELLNPSGGSFINEYTADGEYEVKVKTLGFPERRFTYSWVYPESGSMLVNIPMQAADQSLFRWQLTNEPSRVDLKVSNLTTGRIIYYSKGTGDVTLTDSDGLFIPRFGIAGDAADEILIEIKYTGSLAVLDQLVNISNANGVIGTVQLTDRDRGEYVKLLNAKFGTFNSNVDYTIQLTPFPRV